MFAQNDLPSRSSSRLWTNRLWVLSGVLGAATLGATAGIIHDTERQRAGVFLVAKSTAGELVSAASGHLEILSMKTFAPAAPWDTRPAMARGADLDALLRAQRNAEQCRCRDTLPAAAFFRFDVASGRLDVAPAPNVIASTLPSASAVETVARAEAERARSLRRAGSHFVAPPAFGDFGAVTTVQLDERAAPLVVYGLIANARDIARTVFLSDSTRSLPHEAGTAPLVLDSSGLEVRAEGSRTILGSIGTSHRIRATAIPTAGPLQGLTITTALTNEQVARSLHISRQEMWHLGLLTLATIVVIIFAIGSSRRELLLARARSDFIAGVSHDLRMPLAQILIAGETLTLRRERDETERLKLSSSIVREARRLVSIVDNVLLFSRSGAVALRPSLQPLSVSAIFEEVIDAVRLAVEDAGQTIEMNEPSTLVMLGDRQLVRQALVNLVDNALKYGSPGQHISLRAERHASAVRLYVEDEGPGIPQSERARVFEPYERLARDQTSERTGTGLGLAVVRHIAQVCGGRVWLEESPGHGTRAVLELPGAELPEVPEAVAHERELV